MHQKITFIFTKIHKIVTTRAVHFGLDMHQIVVWGFSYTPLGSLQRSPKCRSWIKGPTSKGWEGRQYRLPRAAQMLAPSLIMIFSTPNPA